MKKITFLIGFLVLAQAAHAEEKWLDFEKGKVPGEYHQPCPEDLYQFYDQNYGSETETGALEGVLTCRVSFQNAGRVGDDDYTAVFYNLVKDRKNDGYTPLVQKTILYRTADFQSESSMPVFESLLDAQGEFFSDAKIYKNSKADILSLYRCLNGTGGCYDEAYLYKDKTWVPLEEDDTWKAMYKAMPAEYNEHKSEGIDFEAMRWKQSIAKATDANCCPSGYIDIQMDIVNDKLSVKNYSYHVEASDD